MFGLRSTLVTTAWVLFFFGDEEPCVELTDLGVAQAVLLALASACVFAENVGAAGFGVFSPTDRTLALAAHSYFNFVDNYVRLVYVVLFAHTLTPAVWGEAESVDSYSVVGGEYGPAALWIFSLTTTTGVISSAPWPRAQAWAALVRAGAMSALIAGGVAAGLGASGSGLAAAGSGGDGHSYQALSNEALDWTKTPTWASGTLFVDLVGTCLFVSLVTAVVLTAVVGVVLAVATPSPTNTSTGAVLSRMDAHCAAAAAVLASHTVVVGARVGLSALGYLV